MRKRRFRIGDVVLVPYIETYHAIYNSQKWMSGNVREVLEEGYIKIRLEKPIGNKKTVIVDEDIVDRFR